MSRQSAKAAGRSTKTARRTPTKTAKKSANGARGTPKQAAKARKPVAKRSHAAASLVARAPSVSPEAMAAMIRTASPPMQPTATFEVPVRAHKYQVGETVYYTSPTFGRAAASGSYTVVKLLPSEGDDYQYRIKNSGEAFERVAKESQLDRA
jgi:hypothetical protein